MRAQGIPIRYYYLLIVTTIGAVLILGGASRAQSSRHVLCGPKCVNAVFRFYGEQEIDPLGMTKFIDDFDNTRGATLQGLRSVLEHHGIHTRLVKISPGAALSWDYPAIFHLEFGGDTGHYVTWYPKNKQATSNVEVFDGISRDRRVPISKWQSRRSGVVLLTSPLPIPDAISPVQPFGSMSDDWFHLFCGIFAVLLGATSFVSSIVFFRKVVR